MGDKLLIALHRVEVGVGNHHAGRHHIVRVPECGADVVELCFGAGKARDAFCGDRIGAVADLNDCVCHVVVLLVNMLIYVHVTR